jgi:hypothetical protein
VGSSQLPDYLERWVTLGGYLYVIATIASGLGLWIYLFLTRHS